MSKVLIVDDVSDNLVLLDYCLAEEGYDIVTANSGPEALRVAEVESPDVVLLDVMMPGMDGVEVCRRLKDHPRLRSVPVILVTALSQEEDIVRGLNAGADDYVTKPFNDKVIVARIRGAVSRYKMQLENARLMAKLEELARTDPLTGIMNRRTFFEHFERELNRATRHQLPLACVMLDIDFFKRINDEHGHAVGDTTLRATADLLLNRCRSTDFVCRYGGEEFCALLPQASELDAVRWAERVRADLAEMKVPADDSFIQITASLGVVGRLDDVQRCNEMVELADRALLFAKGSGRDRVVASSELDETAALS